MRIDDYSQALWQDRPRILGRLLQPFCIGHAMLLHRVKSPMLTGQHWTVVDLVLANEICSLPVPGARMFVEHGNTWWNRLRLRWRVFRAHLIGSDIMLHWYSFRTYLESAYKGPEFSVTRNSEDMIGTPLEVGLMQTLMRHLGMSIDQALATPVHLAIWNACALAEANGSIHLVSDEDDDLVNRAMALANKN